MAVIVYIFVKLLLLHFFAGYDVFLGNLRGLVSREHIDKNISSRKYDMTKLRLIVICFFYYNLFINVMESHLGDLVRNGLVSGQVHMPVILVL